MNKFILDILFFLGVITALTHYVVRDTYVLMFFIMIGIFLFTFFIITKGRKYVNVLLIFFIFSIFFLVRFLFFQEFSHWAEILLLISHFGFAIYLLERKNGLKIVKLVYFMLCTYVIFIAVFGDLSNISTYSSRNIVNYIILAFSILLTGLHYRNNNKILVYPAVLAVIIAFFSLGRAGIISALVLLIGVLIIKYKNKLSKFALAILIITMSVSSYYIYQLGLIVLANIFTKFGTKDTFIEDNARLSIWTAYKDELNIFRTFFGYNSDTHLFAGYTNIHNSFLEAHYTFGLVGIMIIGVLIIALIFFIVKREYLFFLLVICLMFRGMTDTVMLVGMYDFVLVFLILVSNDINYFNKKRRIKLSG